MDLTGAEVSAFLLAESARLSLGSTKGRVGELRSLLRFLHMRGLTVLALAQSVPSVAGWRDTGLPETMTRAEVERLLLTCDRSSVVGVRDHAILMLLARLGLRSIEVARLELADLHWQVGEITVHGKARRCDRLPLPSDVGAALVAYLRQCERNGAQRVFLTVRAPVMPIPPDLVGDVVRRACRRAGLPVVRGHRLRHAFACELLREGASLIDISQVLRHSDLGTTAVYAKVDLVRLRQVAQRWPGAGR
jgi:site-specific recombinase XerD